VSCYFDVKSKISAGGLGDNQNLTPGFVDGAQLNYCRVLSTEEYAPPIGEAWGGYAIPPHQ